MRSMASTRTGGIDTGNAASVADVAGPLKRREARPAGRTSLEACAIYLLWYPLVVCLSIGAIAGVVAGVDGSHFCAWGFSAAGVLHEVPRSEGRRVGRG